MLLALLNDGRPVVGITLSSEALASDVLESAIVPTHGPSVSLQFACTCPFSTPRSTSGLLGAFSPPRDPLRVARQCGLIQTPRRLRLVPLDRQPGRAGLRDSVLVVEERLRISLRAGQPEPQLDQRLLRNLLRRPRQDRRRGHRARQQLDHREPRRRIPDRMPQRLRPTRRRSRRLVTRRARNRRRRIGRRRDSEGRCGEQREQRQQWQAEPRRDAGDCASGGSSSAKHRSTEWDRGHIPP